MADKAKLQRILSPVMAILAGLLLGAVIMVAYGTNPLQAYGEMFGKSFFDIYYLGQTLVRSAPIMLAGLGAAVAWRAGYINLGMQGQMCVGGLCATLVALFFPVKAPWVTVLCFIVGMVAGALWALIPTWLDWKCNVSIVISTIMMNYATNYLTDYFVAYPIRDRAGDGLAQQSPQIEQCMRFLKFSNKNAMNWSLFLAIAMVFLVHFILKRTRFGYESKITGLNRNFATYGGVKSKKMMFTTMAISGAICGFGACIEIFGARYRYIASMFTSTSYAWTGLMAAIIANFNPVMTMVYSIFLAGLAIGGQALQRRVGLPMQIADIIQCCIILFFSVRIAVPFLKKMTRRKKDELQQSVAESKEGN